MGWDATNGGDASMPKREQILGGHHTPSPISRSHGRNTWTKFCTVVDDHKGNVQLVQRIHKDELLSRSQEEDTLGTSLCEVGLPVLCEPFLIVHREQRETPPGSIQALINSTSHF